MSDHAIPYALPNGTDISGYVIDSVLGAGGFGITYRATNPVTGVTVAIKEFFPQGLATRQGQTVVLHADVSSGSYETALRKFEQEAAKLTGRFSHPNIVRGVNFLKANNTAYFVMEFIQGVSLDVWLANRTMPPDEAELRHLFEPILDAVNYIHSFDAMHRDLTPRNIMVRPDGSPMLVDFGAAGEGLDVERPYSTAFAQPNYAPPEQLAHDDGRMQGRHTDIFSLAGVLYRAVAGQPPVRPLKRAQEVHILGDAADPYVPLAQAALYPDHYSQQFFRGIDQGLRIDYRERPSNIADFREALGWWPGTAATEATRPIGYDDVTRPISGSYAHYSDATVAHGGDFDLRADRPTAGVLAQGPRRSVPKLLIASLLLFGIAMAGVGTWVALEPAPKTKPVAPQELRPSTEPPAQVATKPAETAPSTDQPAAPAQPAAPPVVQLPVPSAKPPIPPSVVQAQPPAPVTPVQPPVPATTDGGWTEYTGYVPTGSVIQFVAGVETPKPDQCRAACRDDRSCVAYSVDRNQCSLFTSVTGISLAPNAKAGARSGSPVATTLKGSVERAEQRRGQFKTLEGFAINALGSSVLATPRGVDTDAACAFACTSNGSCKASDFNAETRTCKLLRDVPVDAVTPATGHIINMEDGDGTFAEATRRASVPKPRVMEEFADIDLGGDVIAREPAFDAASCKNICLSEQNCLAALYSDRLCTRYSSVGDMEPRVGSTVFADSRNLALIQRLQTMPTLSSGGGVMQPGAGPQPIGPTVIAPPVPGPTQIGPVQPTTQPPIGTAPVPGPTGPVAITPNPGPQMPNAMSEADQFGGFEIVGPGLSSDLARQAHFAEACEMACQDTATCVGYGFNTAEGRCRLYSGVTDVIPNSSATSGIFKGPGQAAIDTVRRRLAMAEANRANYRPMPAGCAPSGPATTINLGPRGTADQCAFQCRSLASCQAYIFGPRDHSCQILSSITDVQSGIEVVSGVLDPSGRRVKDMAKQCGPIPPAAIGSEGRTETNKPLFRLPW